MALTKLPGLLNPDKEGWFLLGFVAEEDAMRVQALLHQRLLGPVGGNGVAFLPASRIMAKENVQYPVEPNVQRSGI